MLTCVILYLPLLTRVSVYHWCLHMFSTVYHTCLPVFTHVYLRNLCLPMFTRLSKFACVYLCWLVFSYVYLCLLVFTYVYTSLPLFIRVYICSPLFTYVYTFTYVDHCLIVHVYQFLPMLSRVNLVYTCLPMFTCLLLFTCLPLFTIVYHCLLSFT